MNSGYPPPWQHPTTPTRQPKKRPRIVLWIVVCVAAGILALGAFWGAIAAISYARGTGKSAPYQVPDKYNDGDFPDCASFTAHSPDLPTVAHQVTRISNPRLADSGLLQCTFSTRNDGDPSVMFKADWSLTNNAGTGSEKEHNNFVGATSDSSDNHPVNINIGQDSRWLDEKDGRSCALILLDQNTTFEVHYTPAVAGQSPQSEACRGPLRKVTQELYAAAQLR